MMEKPRKHYFTDEIDATAWYSADEIDAWLDSISVDKIEDAINAFWDNWEAPSNGVYSKDLALAIKNLIGGLDDQTQRTD
jgi:hypothetical protein